MRNAKILVVDESALMCSIVKNVLFETGYHIFSESEKIRIYERIEKISPDLILLDVFFSGKQQYELCPEIIKSGCTAPIILTSKSLSDENITLGYNAGASDYIIKPFREKELIARVNLHLKNKFYTDEIKAINEELSETNNQLAELNGQLQNALEENKRLAERDGLTGLFNRRFTTNSLEDACKKAKDNSEDNIFVAISDIDNFKKINDTYGHNTGDIVLKSMAKHLLAQQNLIALPGRWGGEEFVFFINGSNKENAIAIANTIRSSIATDIFKSEKGDFSCTVTIGITEVDGALSPSDNLKKADEALYEGKTGGKNRVVFG